MLKDPVKFYKKISSPNVQVVCLTATPDDGYSDGTERQLIQLMGFTCINTSKQVEMQVPPVGNYASFGTAQDIMNEVDKRKLYQGVLIYANEPFYSQLQENHYVNPVTHDTNDDDLRKMDKKNE